MKKILALILAMSMVFALAACGDKTSDENVSDNTNPTVVPTDTAAPDTEVVAADTMAESVTLSAMDDVTNMNPWVARNTAWNVVMLEVYEPMGAYDSFGGKFHGVLMESWEQVDDVTFRAKLYENIFDSEGNQIKASDVAFSYAQCVAVGEMAELQVCDSVTAIDDYTVEYVWTSAPGLGAFESFMCNLYIVSEASFNASENEFRTDPVGTGPYKVVDYVPGSYVALEATENYWQSEDNFVVPTQYSNVKNIRMEVISETAQIAMALQTGSIDISASVGSEDLVQFDEGGQYSDGYSIYSYPQTSGESLMPNCSPDSPMSDINLRLAVFHAIDQEGVMAMVSGGKTVALASFGGVSYPDYNEDWVNGNYAYDLDLAKEYLAKTDFANGGTLRMNVIQGNPRQEEEAVVIQQYLAELGIELVINSYPIAQYLPLQGDSTAWDFLIAGFPANGYLANCWAKYFYTDSPSKNFVDDSVLQELVATAYSVDGHSADSMNAVMEHMQANAYFKGLCNSFDNVVYNSDLIEGVVLNQENYMCPGAFTYNAG